MTANSDPVADCEKAVLGAVIVHNRRYEECTALGIGAEHFSDPFHREIWRALGEMVAAGTEASPISLGIRFDRHRRLAKRSARFYFATLVEASCGIVHMKDHARLLFEQAGRRRLGNLGEALCRGAEDNAKDFNRLLAETQAMLEQCRPPQPLKPPSAPTAMMPLVEAVREAQAGIARVLENGGVDGVPYGLAALDELLGGAAKSDLVVMAGRPGMGKTALAWHVAQHNARAGKRVAFFTLEMSAAQLASRAIGQIVEVGADRLRRGALAPTQQAAVAEADNWLDLPVYLNRHPVADPDHVRDRAHELQRDGGLDLVVVDYLQLLHTDDPADNRVQELARISRGLKLMAGELNLPVIALSQLNRAVEGRDDKRPMLFDLRDSGAIEQDADAVILVYREEYYVAQKEPREDNEDAFPQWLDRMRRCAGTADLIVAKNRHGPCATATVGFDGTLTRFYDLAKTGGGVKR